MEIIDLVDKGTPVLIVGLAVLVERLRSKINDMQEDIKEIKTGITWKATCEERHGEVGRRLNTLERKAHINGGAD